MKKFLSLTLFFLFSCFLFAAEPTPEQKQAVFMMNYAQYVTYKLKTYNNILALEEEYMNLKDNMNFETIKDADSIDTINRLMDSIYNERKNHKNRERLEQSVERRMNKALFNSIPQVTTIVSGRLDPLSIAINTARTAGGIFVSYQQYKDQLSEEYDAKMLEYQTLSEDILNDIYRDLNTYTYDLMKNYTIPDEWRLNETELKKIFEYLKDTNRQRAYTNLKNMSTGRFVQHFPMFWYHLAKIAHETGDESAALRYYARFENENIEIFRYDTTAVDAFKGEISLLLKNPGSTRSEIISKLSFIERNKTSWNDYYFCALVYAQLRDTQNAKRLLEKNINELSSSVDQQFLEGAYLDKILNEGGGSKTSSGLFVFFGGDKKNPDEGSSAFEAAGSSDYDGLELSRALLKKLGDDENISVQSIEDQYKSSTQSVNEILWWFGVNPASYVIKNSAKDIKEVLVTMKVFSEKSCQVDLKIPLQWVMSSNTDLQAIFLKPGSSEPVVIPLHIDEKETQKLKKAKASLSPKNTILYYTTGEFNLNWKKEGYSFSCILLNHPIYPVQFVYPIEINKPKKNVQPNVIYVDGKRYDL